MEIEESCDNPLFEWLIMEVGDNTKVHEKAEYGIIIEIIVVQKIVFNLFCLSE